MVLCNVTKLMSTDFSLFNITSEETAQVTQDATNTSVPEDIYDSKGAMEFTVAVVMVYGMAVMGVIGLGFCNRKKRQVRHMDQEAIEFIKNYDDVRKAIDKQTRVGAVSALLQSIHNGPMRLSAERKNLFGNFDGFLIPMTTIKEYNEQNKDENNNGIEATRNPNIETQEELAHTQILEGTETAAKKEMGMKERNEHVLFDNHTSSHKVIVYSNTSAFNADYNTPKGRKETEV